MYSIYIYACLYCISVHICIHKYYIQTPPVPGALLPQASALMLYVSVYTYVPVSLMSVYMYACVFIQTQPVPGTQLPLVTVCILYIQCVAVCCSMLQCVAVCCSVLQCVAVCCSVLQGVAVYIVYTYMLPLPRAPVHVLYTCTCLYCVCVYCIYECVYSTYVCMYVYTYIKYNPTQRAVHKFH